MKSRGRAVSRGGRAVLLIGCTIVLLAGCVVYMPPGGGGAAPSAPTNVSANAPSGTEVDLTWMVPGTSPIDHYSVTRNGVTLGGTVNPSYIDTTAVAGQTYYYGVSSVATGNLSSAATLVVAVTPGPNAAQRGQWGNVSPYPEVAVHAALTPNGKVLTWQGSFSANGVQYLFDPVTGTSAPLADAAANLFCGGQTTLADGRIMVIGGTSLTGGLGTKIVKAFNSTTNSWQTLAPMQYPRWYATGTTLSDGRVLSVSGYNTASGDLVTLPEVYTPGTNTWTTLTNATRAIPVYPFMYQLPGGRVMWAGASERTTPTEVLDLATQQWTTIDSRLIDGGSMVNYAPGKFMKAGTASDDGVSGTSANTAYTLDMNQPSPTWQPTGSMNFGRTFLNLTALPDGTVLATGGGSDRSSFVDGNAVLPAEDWNPQTGTWTTLAAMTAPRLYHSTAVLLPDGRVLVAGGGGDAGVMDQKSTQIYAPPYLFKGPRPVITSAPASSAFGATQFVGTPQATSIASAVLIRTASVTHAFDQNARAIPVSFTQASGGINVQMPANGTIAPPGYYMLFIVNSVGVPSVAKFVNFPG